MRVRRALLGVVLLAAGLAGAARAAEKITLRPAAMEDDAFAVPPAEGAAVSPGPGQIGLVGRVGGSRFAVRDLRHVQLTGPDGRAVPLLIEKSSLFVEFDRIVGMRFCCTVPEGLVAGNATFVLSWGDDVEAENRLADRLAPDPSARGRFRRLEAAPSDEESNADVATIVVVADSYASWHFLWYLLPLACIVALLMIRKLRIGNRTDPTRS